MATKNCPKCSSQVPVACKKCSCGHCFFTTRKGSGTSGSGQSSSSGASTSKQDTAVPEAPVVLRDRIPRERGRPAFYDAQELDAQMKKSQEAFKEETDTFDCTFENVFVTVGTTSYEKLIDLVLATDTAEQFQLWGTTHIKIQYGQGKHLERWRKMAKKNKLIPNVEFYDYKPDLTDDMNWADLVISHAGSGTTMDALRVETTLIVVPNEDLMDNHQLELAYALRDNNYAFCASLATFLEVTRTVRRSLVKPFPKRNEEAFTSYLYEIMAFDPEHIRAFTKKD